ncbi:MAG TPA: GrpB family protein [Ktedonobacterales bacterium]|jgi:GrpB-like predicted nucleotidyltransferase (UPF0157 family)|nr:GrpB family protein [Ktedonobacterales bacterium]
MSSDPVIVVPYDPAWPDMFARQATALRQALGPVARRIDHIGSTSIPGLAAKPVIDVQISVADFEPLAAYRVPLEHLGYVFRAENSERTKRYFREAPGTRRSHLHVRRAGSFSEQLALLFRDFVRHHTDVADEYARVKRDLALQFRDDRVAYTDMKQPFIWSVVARADAWAQATGWLPGESDA